MWQIKKTKGSFVFIVLKDLDLLKEFGNRVRILRRAENISQEELADRAGLHRTYIGMIERAEKNITLLNCQKIAIGLNVSISELLKFENAQ